MTPTEFRAAALRALIFDMDGTLVHTDEQHFGAYVQVFADLGKLLTRSEYDSKMAGRPNMEILREYFPDATDNYRRDLANLKEATFRKLSPNWELLAGLPTLLAWERRRGLKQVLVTSAPRDMAAHLLRAVELTGTFNVEVYADELPRGKPDPLPYLTALEQLTLKAEQCLVFEDSLFGVMSAAGAGIFTVGVATTQHPDALYAAGAGLVVQDFTDPALWRLLEPDLT